MKILSPIDWGVALIISMICGASCDFDTSRYLNFTGWTLCLSEHFEKYITYNGAEMGVLQGNYGPFVIYDAHQTNGTLLFNDNILHEEAKALVKEQNRRVGINSCHYFSKIVEIQRNGSDPFRGFSGLFITNIEHRMSELILSHQLSQPNSNATAIYKGIKNAVFGIVRCFHKFTALRLISNAFHPKRIGYLEERKPKPIYHGYITELSLGSRANESNVAHQFYLKPEPDRIRNVFPVFYYGDDIETLDLESLKGNYRRNATHEKCSCVYASLRLIDELPFYTRTIESLMQKKARLWKRLATFEMCRVHLTLVPDELKGKFKKHYLHYRSSDHWKSIENVEEIPGTLNELWTSKTDSGRRGRKKKLHID